MDAEHPKSLSKLRTFAQDVERARQKSGVAVPQDIKKAELPKAASPSAPQAPIVFETKKAEVPPPDKHIPAFHELQKKSSASTVHSGPNITATTPKTPAPKRTVSVRTRKPDLKSTKNVGGGTIITDSKAEGFKLIPAIIKSIDNWLLEIKKSFKKKTAPKYVVTDAERRRGVIQKATSKTGSIFTADNETLKEEIRRRQAAGVSENVDINWTPNTEPGYALLESGAPKPVTSNVAVTFKKQTSPVEGPEAPVVIQEVKPAPVVRVETPAKAQPVVPPPVIVEPTAVPEINPEPAPAIQVETAKAFVEETFEETAPEEVPIEETYELTTPEEHSKIKSLGDISRINTNLLSIGIIGAIAALIIFIVLVRALLSFIISNETTIDVPPPTPITEIATAIDVKLDSVSQESVLAGIQNVGNTTTITEVRFLDAEGVPISTEALLPLLGFNSRSNLDRTISDIHVIVRGQERGLIFTVTDSTTALGLLLSSEDELVVSLSETLNVGNTDTSGKFSDLSFGTTDVRVYTVDNFGQRFVYGFTDTNTVLITSTLAFFTTIVGNQ